MKYSNRQLADIDNIAKTDMQMEGRIIQIIQASFHQTTAEVAKLHATLDGIPNKQRISTIDDWKVAYKDEIGQVAKALSEVANDESQKRIQRLILHSLEYQQLKERYHNIEEAHQATFNWIFESEPNQSVPWSNFVEWLSSADNSRNLYWITGKPASGKSTLMKCLYNEDRTKDHLQQWAGRKRLVLASCFF